MVQTGETGQGGGQDIVKVFLIALVLTLVALPSVCGAVMALLLFGHMALGLFAWMGQLL